ncbi:MAG TPA: glycosyltransferase family 2 protein [bacterium]
MPKTRPKSSSAVQISVVTPAFNEAPNLPLLYNRLKKALDKLHLRWEWIVVDDHSADETYRVMESIARKDKRVRVLRFSKNSGSHLALACALKEAKGQCAVGMAADLQDTPETIGKLYAKWKGGAKVVWAVRGEREGESFSTVFFARLYYFTVRYGVGLKQIPPTGADFFLLDRVVINRLAQAQVRNASILLLICSFGFRQDYITYTKRQRAHGKTGWSLKKKLKLFFDSITMFSKAPIYWAWGVGLALVGTGSGGAVRSAMGWGFSGLGIVLMAAGLAFLGLGMFLFIRLTSPVEETLFSIEKGTDHKKSTNWKNNL